TTRTSVLPILRQESRSTSSPRTNSLLTSACKITLRLSRRILVRGCRALQRTSQGASMAGQILTACRQYHMALPLRG
ncbi:hypothetical protein N0V95_010137, partial [Ascochyta clinopodiicola]